MKKILLFLLSFQCLCCFAQEYLTVYHGDSVVMAYKFAVNDSMKFENYEDFKLKSDFISFQEGVEIMLPKEFCIPAGENFQLFYRGAVKCFNPYVFQLHSICSEGKAFPRYYQLTTDESMAGKTYSLKVNAYDNKNDIVCTKSTSLRVVSPLTSPSTPKNILCIGASATANGYWPYELNRRLTEKTPDSIASPSGLGLENITFVGRKKGSTKKIPLEATGGWRWTDYSGKGRAAYRFYVTGVNSLHLGDTYDINGTVVTITEINVTEGTGNIRCTYSGSKAPDEKGTLKRKSGSGDKNVEYTSYESEKYNPFYNDDRLDFKNYADMYCDGHIDVLIAHCGMNDVFASANNASTIEQHVKPFIRAFHQDFPDAYFVLSSIPLPDMRGGMGANYGANQSHYYMNISYRLWDLAKRFEQLSLEDEFAPYVLFAPVVQQFDSEYSYPVKTQPVNNRDDETEEMGTNAVHPTAAGSYQVADAVFRSMHNIKW